VGGGGGAQDGDAISVGGGAVTVSETEKFSWCRVFPVASVALITRVAFDCPVVIEAVFAVTVSVRVAPDPPILNVSQVG